MSPLPPEDFWEYFETHRRFPDGSYVAARGYRSEAQKELKYKQYVRNCESKSETRIRAIARQSNTRRAPIASKIDARWELVREAVLHRDRHQCRLTRVLTASELAQLTTNSGGQHKLIDCAHIKARSTHPELKYAILNVVALNRYSHSCLDTCRDPVSGRKITPDEAQQWWKRIQES